MNPLNKFEIGSLETGGSFACIRKYDIHTGIDLYCEDGDEVFAMEDGIVINICNFTGKYADSPWWNDTMAVLIEGESGIILYGEINPCVSIGQSIKTGEIIGNILRVLKEDKGKPMSMLHLELYDHGYTGDGEIWNLGHEIPNKLKDPTNLIKKRD